MSNYVVEDIFEYNGLKCVVVMRDLAYRCGYVGIPIEHSLYGKDYLSYLPPFIGSKIKIEDFFKCHGGISYSDGGVNSKYPIESDLWWFGFDCAHGFDANDYEAAKKLFADDAEALERINKLDQFDNRYYLYKGKEIRTLEYVSDECKKLADQLLKFSKIRNAYFNKGDMNESIK